MLDPITHNHALAAVWAANVIITAMEQKTNANINPTDILLPCVPHNTWANKIAAAFAKIYPPNNAHTIRENNADLDVLNTT